MALREAANCVIENMIGFVDLGTAVQRILRDDGYGRVTLGKVRGLLASVWDAYQYEETLLNAVNRMIGADHARALCAALHTYNRGTCAPWMLVRLACVRAVARNTDETAPACTVVLTCRASHPRTL